MWTGYGDAASGVAMRMTRQYVAGELSVLLAHLQAVTTTDAAGRDAWALRHAAETVPIPGLGLVTERALALTGGFGWESLNRRGNRGPVRGGGLPRLLQGVRGPAHLG